MIDLSTSRQPQSGPNLHFVCREANPEPWCDQKKPDRMSEQLKTPDWKREIEEVENIRTWSTSCATGWKMPHSVSSRHVTMMSHVTNE